MTSQPVPTDHTAHQAESSRSPADEAAHAIQSTLSLLTEAEHLLASGTDEQYPLAYEHVAACADHIARALWFLRRTQQARAGQGQAG